MPVDNVTFITTIEHKKPTLHYIDPKPNVCCVSTSLSSRQIPLPISPTCPYLE